MQKREIVFLPNAKDFTSLNFPPLLPNDTLVINALIVSDNVIEVYPVIIISGSLTCRDILALFISVSLVVSILTVILLGYSPIHNVVTCK